MIYFVKGAVCGFAVVCTLVSTAFISTLKDSYLGRIAYGVLGACFKKTHPKTTIYS